MVTLFQSLYTLSLVAGERVSGRVTSLKEERGASAVEYALLVGLIAAAVVSAVTFFRPMLEGLFQNVDVNGGQD
ncbi:Flp family type IVb pilin [Modestobacter altitudinis]|uniref:Flp family type IVb pilin n=1 Tax=Modestobacter altitudinis TaxID=2213158 RepID=UPI00110C9417|nr:Flp family type IVb pilin [Modestobacter altitudinis]